MAQALPGNSNRKFPYDDKTQRAATGSPRDTAKYVAAPGVDFYRPWLTIPGGKAFVWPGGVEGFSCRIDPQLGIHRYIGGNAVVVDVTHKGQESITLSGSFPGLTSVDAFLALRDLIYQDMPDGGMILYVPHLFPKTQRVFVQSATFDHARDERNRDLTYTVDFVKVGTGNRVAEPRVRTMVTQPTIIREHRGRHPRVVVANSTLNTLRKIARVKLKNAARWDELYRKNEKFFKSRSVSIHQVPNYRLPPGTKVEF